MAKRRKRPSASRAARELRGTEILTTVWMLTVLTALACQLGFLAIRLAAAWSWRSTTFDVLAGILLFAAVVVGFISLLLSGVVVKSRSEATPRPVLVFSLIVGAAPLVMVVAQLVR